VDFILSPYTTSYTLPFKKVTFHTVTIQLLYSSYTGGIQEGGSLGFGVGGFSVKRYISVAEADRSNLEAIEGAGRPMYA
jgi:hypothetical protein